MPGYEALIAHEKLLCWFREPKVWAPCQCEASKGGTADCLEIYSKKS